MSELQSAIAKAQAITAAYRDELFNENQELRSQLEVARSALLKEGMERDAFKAELELARKCVEALRRYETNGDWRTTKKSLDAYDKFKEQR